MIYENDVIKATVIESLELFTRYFFKKRNKKKFVIGEHHRIIFESLEKVINGYCTRLIINIAPRYGKTEIAVKSFIAYSLALNPRAKFIHLSYADQLALDNSEEIKDLITSEEFQTLFPELQIKKDSKAKNKWYTTQGGGVLARSAGGQVTGFGAGETDDLEFESELFGGAIIIDDPIKPDDATSDLIRDRINQRFDSTIRSRVNSRKTPIIVIMQRIHEEDLTGYLTTNEPGEWEVINLPVIKEDGTALWDYKHTLEELYKLRKSNEFVFETQYMQNPKPKVGYLFPLSDLKRFKDINNDLTEGKLGYIDVADTGEDSHSVVIGRLQDKKIYITDVLYTKVGTDKNLLMTADILNRTNPEYCRIESNMGGGMYKQLLEPLVNSSIQLLSIRNTTHKHTRIMTLSGFIKDYCYFKEDYTIDSDYGLFMKNLTYYLSDGSSKHDDAPDSLQGLVKFFRVLYQKWSEYSIMGAE